MAVVFQLKCVCVICLITLVHSEDIDRRYFLRHIVDEYGSNGSISYQGFKHLYQNLGLGSSSEFTARNDDSKSQRNPHGADLKRNECKTEEESHLEDHESSQQTPPSPGCLSDSQLLALYGAPGPNTSLSPDAFLQLCPALIYKLDQRTFPQLVNDDHVSSTSMANYLYAVISVSVISLTGLLCVAVIPLLQKSFISQLISFLVALAIGTLLGDAFLHLIPHALEGEGGSHHHSNSILNTALMFLSTAGFFTIDAVMKVCKHKKEEEKHKQHAHYLPVNCNNGEKEMMVVIKDPIEEKGHSHSSGNTIIMILVGDGLHNFIDGLAIGGAYAGGAAAGFATSVAVLTHELPHELGDFAVLLQSGMTVRRALMCNLLQSLLSLFGMVLGLVAGNFGSSWVYAITAGMFIYTALTSLVPEMNRELQNWSGVLLRLMGFLLGGVIMGAIALFEHRIQDVFQQS